MNVVFWRFSFINDDEIAIASQSLCKTQTLSPFQP